MRLSFLVQYTSALIALGPNGRAAQTTAGSSLVNKKTVLFVVVGQAGGGACSSAEHPSRIDRAGIITSRCGAPNKSARGAQDLYVHAVIKEIRIFLVATTAQSS